jgi:cyanophycinase
MRRIIFRLALLLLVGILTANAATRGPTQGTLVIVGGGQLGPEIIQRFVSLAGGKDAKFVVIPTASEEPTIDVEKTKERFAKSFGVANVTVLHTKDRKVADSKQFTEPLRHASAVWIPGGRQWRLADSYLKTRTEREIKNVLKRGGVVGGSSAGATIQGSYLVRGAVEGNTVMMSPGHEAGFALLTDSAVDQHIITRHRESDLDPVVEKFPKLLGIGIDESTAIIVHGDQFEVIGKSKVAIHDRKEHEGKKFYFLTAGQKYDLKHRAVMAAGGDK